MFTLQEKCFNFVGHALIEHEFNKTISQREHSFLQVFIADKTKELLKINSSSNATPFNGFSYYKFEYPSGVPIELRKAFKRMCELDNENPRKKYKRLRRK